MIDMKWFNSHIGDETDAQELINAYYWNITWGKKNKLWKVWSGDKVILETDSEEICKTFVYGMSLAYSIIPAEYTDRFRAERNYDGQED